MDIKTEYMRVVHDGLQQRIFRSLLAGRCHSEMNFSFSRSARYSLMGWIKVELSYERERTKLRFFIVTQSTRDEEKNEAPTKENRRFKRLNI